MRKFSWKDKLVIMLAPPLAALVIRLLRLLVSVDLVNVGYLHSKSEERDGIILSFWHDQFLLMPTIFDGLPAKIMISSSKDGELITRTVGWFGQGAVRGSSSRGGREAFRELVKLGRERVDLVITPDGPKGPRHQIKDGVVQMAKITKRQVYPLAFACSRGHRFGSWDRFLLPYPFAKCVYMVGAPVHYRETDNTDGFRDRLQVAMDITTRSAQEYLEETYGVPAV